MYPIDNFSHGSFWHCIKSNRILNSIIVLTIFFKFQFRNIQRANRFIPKIISNIYRIEREIIMQYIPYIYYIYLPTTCSCWISIMQNRVQRKKKRLASETIITPSWETKSCEKRLVKFYENLIWNGASQLTEPKRMRYIYDMIYDDDDNSIVNPEPGKLPHTTLNK